MFRFARSPFFCFVAAASCSISLFAVDGAVGRQPIENASAIVIGFAGGFVRHNNPFHGPVRLARRIQQDLPHGTYVQVFENRHRKTAYKTILRLLDRDHDGVLTDEEKAQARIILFGHSWGAAAAVLLARELEQLDIPVLLTVQVDSVAKFWQHDGVIPDNVASAVNFYQPHGFIHGRSKIWAADPSRTQILGNYRFDYSRAPISCEGATWFDRTFMGSHIESNCDPHIWSQAENLIRQRMEASPGVVAAVP